MLRHWYRKGGKNLKKSWFRRGNEQVTNKVMPQIRSFWAWTKCNVISGFYCNVMPKHDIRSGCLWLFWKLLHGKETRHRLSKQEENPSNVPAAILYHIRFFMANFLYLPNFLSLEHPYGLEEAPVVHWLGPGYHREVWWTNHWLCHGQFALYTTFQVP